MSEHWTAHGNGFICAETGKIATREQVASVLESLSQPDQAKNLREGVYADKDLERLVGKTLLAFDSAGVMSVRLLFSDGSKLVVEDGYHFE